MKRAPESSVRQGDIIGGKYRVDRVLGKGAMGVVVEAFHLELEERRAIKLMLPSVLGSRESVERFFREARAAARLRSRHAATIHDIGRLDDGAPFIVMEYLEGTDLKRVLEARGRLDVAEAVSLLLQACEAIGEAHSLGIIHRDLKPGNLFVARAVDGGPLVKVVDFGIAKVPEREGREGLTRQHSLLGTPLYMSPEQMRGASAVDARSDIWSLGAILYRMLTDETPFTGDTVPSICSAVLTEEPAPPSARVPTLPRALDAAVLRCLAKDPAHRFATVADLVAAIRPFAGASAAAPPVANPVPLDASRAVPGRSHLASTFVAQATPHGHADPSATLIETKNSTAGIASWAHPGSSTQGAARPPQDAASGRFARVALIAVVLGAAIALAVFFVMRTGATRPSASSQAMNETPENAADATAGLSSRADVTNAPATNASAPAPSTTSNASTSASSDARASASLEASASPTTATTSTRAAPHFTSPHVATSPTTSPPPAASTSDAFGRNRK